MLRRCGPPLWLVCRLFFPNHAATLPPSPHLWAQISILTTRTDRMSTNMSLLYPGFIQEVHSVPLALKDSTHCEKSKIYVQEVVTRTTHLAGSHIHWRLQLGLVSTQSLLISLTTSQSTLDGSLWCHVIIWEFLTKIEHVTSEVRPFCL